MNVVVEGADGSGKSTLVDFLRQNLKWPVVSSKGPTKTIDELNDRARVFLSYDRTIFDRHCIISEEIYGSVRGNVMTDPRLVADFTLQQNLIIYCRHEGTLQHTAKGHDTAEHLELVMRNHQRICAAYDLWALRFAHVVYRKYDDKSRILQLIQGLTQ